MGLFSSIGKLAGFATGSTGVGLIGGVLGDYLDANSASDAAAKGVSQQNDWNAAQAQANRDWQERMSSTAYQRVVKDMSAAGLNPMLAYSQGGASTPGGSIAAPSGNSKMTGIQGAQLAAQTANSAASTDLLEAQTEKTRAEKALVEAQTSASTSSAGHMDAQKDQIRQNMNKFVLEYELLAHQGKLISSQAGRESIGYNVDLATQRERIERLRSEATQAAYKAKLLGLDIPQSEVFANYYKSAVGKASPYVDLGTRALGSVTSSAYRLNAMDRR